MTVYNPQTERYLNDILTILGVTKTSLWPFWESTGQLVTCIGVADLIPSNAGAAEDLEHDFAPLKLPCGLYSYHFNPAGDCHLAGTDNAAYTFIAGAFSVGAWIRPSAISSNAIMAKYDSAGNAEEWRFWIDANGNLALELHDANVSASEIAISDTVDPVLNQMQFVVATYDGTPATPLVYLYINGIAVNDGTTAETNAFVDMEDTATPLTIGCGGVTAVPTTEFHGRIAMPFLCGKQLTAAEVVTLRDIMRPLIGIS